jgi:hypothetical protein
MQMNLLEPDLEEAQRRDLLTAYFARSLNRRGL